MTKVFEADLDDGIEYSHQGTMATAYKISFTAPNYKCRDASIKIRELLLKGVAQMSNDAAAGGDDDKSELDPDEPLPAIMVSVMLGDNLSAALKAFDKIAVQVGTIKAENDVPLKATHLERLSEEDYLKVAVGYIGFFTARSLLSQMTAS